MRYIGAVCLALDALACVGFGVGSWVASPASQGVGLFILSPGAILLGCAAVSVWREARHGRASLS